MLLPRQAQCTYDIKVIMRTVAVVNFDAHLYSQETLLYKHAFIRLNVIMM